MTERTWTADELKQLTPDDRRDVVWASFVDDLTRLPSPLVERQRRRGEELLRERGLLDPAS